MAGKLNSVNGSVLVSELNVHASDNEYCQNTGFGIRFRFLVWTILSRISVEPLCSCMNDVRPGGDVDTVQAYSRVRPISITNGSLMEGLKSYAGVSVGSQLSVLAVSLCDQ